jgi:hypothetical protein
VTIPTGDLSGFGVPIYRRFFPTSVARPTGDVYATGKMAVLKRTPAARPVAGGIGLKTYLPRDSHRAVERPAAPYKTLRSAAIFQVFVFLRSCCFLQLC